MKVLITGNLGAIGSSLSKNLESNGILFQGFDNRYPYDHPFFGDIRDQERLKKAMFKCDGVIHLAAISRVLDAQNDSEKTIEVNVQGTQNIIDSLNKNQWLIFTSSREVYGKSSVIKLGEHSPSNPQNLYGLSKSMAEETIRNHCKGSYTILRLTNVYGSLTDRSERLIPSLVRCALENKPITVFGPERCFDFVHIHDICNGFIGVIDKMAKSSKITNQILNLTSGEGVRLSEVADQCRKLSKSDIPIHYGLHKNYEVDNFIGDPRQAKQVLNWEAKIPFATGLNNYIEQCKQGVL
ncbi:NAD(P)-dependent oxidoreductase [bacterium]|nr:NAD(P)-dependent oxidoreductase [bacterium]